MKRFILVIAFCFLSGRFTMAQRSGFGIGLMLGEPTGVAGNYWIDKNNSFDFGIGAGFLGGNSGFSIHADYLYNIDDLFGWKYKIPFYYGFGVRTRFPSNSSMAFGVRGVLGLMMLLKNLPVDVFIEVAPSFRLLPTTGLDIDFAIGGRYYFANINKLF